MNFSKNILPNGIRVVTESHPESRAVSMGLWVLTGTRDEPKGQTGISHFLEHLVFKGTKTRTAYQIAKSLEALGGELNAYTSREATVYHCYVLKDHWLKGLEVLSDLVSNMEISKTDFEVERSVIQQEIGLSEDELEDLVYDYFLRYSLPNHALGHSILGYPDTVGGITKQKIFDYYRKTYQGPQIIVSAAGAIDHDEVVKSVQKFLGRKKRKKLIKKRVMPKYQVIKEVFERPSEQLHLLMGFPVTSFKDELRFEAFIVNSLLGGGMTSKLYQSVREKKGLVYSIYSSLNTFEDFGFLQVYAASEKAHIKQVHKNIIDQIAKLKKQKISKHDLEMFKTQVKGAILLGSDDMENRMGSLAVNEIVFGKYKSVEDVIAEIDKVSVSSVSKFIDKYVDVKKVSTVLMGGGAEEFRDWLRNEKN